MDPPIFMRPPLFLQGGMIRARRLNGASVKRRRRRNIISGAAPTFPLLGLLQNLFGSGASFHSDYPSARPGSPLGRSLPRDFGMKKIKKPAIKSIPILTAEEITKPWA